MFKILSILKRCFFVDQFLWTYIGIKYCLNLFGHKACPKKNCYLKLFQLKGNIFVCSFYFVSVFQLPCIKGEKWVFKLYWWMSVQAILVNEWSSYTGEWVVKLYWWMSGQAILVNSTKTRYSKFSACSCFYKEDSLSIENCTI